jgi:predicted dehydrogenase
MSLSVAIVGCGWFGRHHQEAWARVGRARVVALVDTDLRRARAAAQAFPDAAAFADAEPMLAQLRPDVVDLVTPMETHAALVDAAARHGVDVICQKPLAASLTEAEAIVRRAERAGIRLMMHENFRFRPWFVEARRLIAAGMLGKPLHLAFRLRTGDGRGENPYPEQPYFRSMPRFLLLETCLHFVDVFRLLFGEIVAVSAHICRRNPAIAGEDAAMVIFDFASGATGLFDGDRSLDHQAADPRLTLGTMLIEGEEASLRLDGEGRLHLRRRGRRESEHPFPCPARGYRGDSVYAQTEHIVAHLLDGAPLVNSGRAYLRNMAVIEAAYLSAEQGRRAVLDGDAVRQ